MRRALFLLAAYYVIVIPVSAGVYEGQLLKGTVTDEK